MKLRPAMLEEREQFLSWAEGNRLRNSWDERVLDYPLCAVMAAVNGKVVAYIPTHPVLILDSVAPNPEASAEELQEALLMFLGAAEKCAKMTGMGEVMFLASDPRVAAGSKRQGFVESGMKVYRKVLA